MILSTNCKGKKQLVVIQYERNSIITGPTVYIQPLINWNSLYRSGLSRKGLEAACHVLAAAGSSLDGALALLKTSFLPDACRMMRTLLQTRDDARASPLLSVLAALASHDEGQLSLLRSAAAPSLLDLLLMLTREAESRLARCGALLVLRNLAMRHDNKPHFLADPRFACTPVMPF